MYLACNQSQDNDLIFSNKIPIFQETTFKEYVVSTILNNPTNDNPKRNM